MVRPVNANSTETVERILEAARTLLREEGQEGWSMRRVATAANVSTGTLQYYFTNRAELLDACLDPFHEELRALEQTFMSLLESADDPLAVLGQGIAAIYRFAVGTEAGQRVVIQSMAEKCATDTRRRQLFREPFLARIVALVKPFTKQDARTIRMYTMSMTFLVTRYAASTDAALLELTSEQDIEAAHRVVEQHLVSTAKAFMVPSR